MPLSRACQLLDGLYASIYLLFWSGSHISVQPFPASPRNSAAAVVNMLKKTNCSRIITLEHAHKPLIDGIRHEIGGAPLIIYELPTLRYAFPKLGQEVALDSFTPYPPPLKRPDLDSPAIYIHSSGSTGFPKAIVHSHRIQVQWLAQRMLLCPA